jgi:hypothetical protein
MEPMTEPEAPLSLRFLGVEDAHVPVFALGRGEGDAWHECDPPKRYGPTPIAAVDLEQWAVLEGMDPRRAKVEVTHYHRLHGRLFTPYMPPESVQPWDQTPEG